MRLNVIGCGCKYEKKQQYQIYFLFKFDKKYIKFDFLKPSLIKIFVTVM